MSFNCTTKNWTETMKGEEPAISLLKSYVELLKTIFVSSSFILIIVLLWITQTKTKIRRAFIKKRIIPKVSWFPVNIPFLDGLYTPFKLRNDGVHMFEDLVEKYGPIFELPFGKITIIVTTDTSVIKKVLSSTNVGHLNKPKYIYGKLFENVLSQGLISADHCIWSSHRGIANRAFSYRNLHEYLKIMNRQANCLVKKLHDKNTEVPTKDGIETHEMNKILDFHTLGIIAESLYGPICYSEDINQNIQRNIHRAKEITLFRFMHPELFIEYLWKLHPKQWELDRLWNKFSQALMEIVDIYHAQISKQKDFSEYKFCSPMSANNTINDNDEDEWGWVDMNFDENGEELREKPFRFMIEEMIRCGMCDSEIYSEIATFLIAVFQHSIFITEGFETTVVSLNTLMLHLALNPAVQAKCREEVDNIINAKGIEDNLDLEFTMEDLTSMKYMERCVLENFRLTFPVPTFGRELQAPLKVNEELEFKAGQVIMLLPWVLHKDSQHFPSPLEFNPDRFLAENVKERDPFAYIPFSGGSRGCIGRKFAMMEMKILVASILRDYEIHTVEHFDKIKFFVEATIRPEREIKMTFRRRRSSSQ